MAFIKTKHETDLYCDDWGQGRPVVLMHGWRVDAGMWFIAP